MSKSFGEAARHIDLGIVENQAELDLHTSALNGLETAGGTVVAIRTSLETAQTAMDLTAATGVIALGSVQRSITALGDSANALSGVGSELDDAVQSNTIAHNAVDVMGSYITDLHAAVGSNGTVAGLEQQALGRANAAVPHYLLGTEDASTQPVPAATTHVAKVELNSAEFFPKVAQAIDKLGGKIIPFTADIETSTAGHEAIREEVGAMLAKIAAMAIEAELLVTRLSARQESDAKLAAKIGEAIADVTLIEDRVTSQATMISEELVTDGLHVIELAEATRNRLI